MDQHTKQTFLCFLLKDINMCVHLNNVCKILPLPALEWVPKSPNYFVGLMNIAGKNIPVIDLAIRLGIPRQNEYSIFIPIIYCKVGKLEAGLIVDQIIGLSTLHRNDLQLTQEFQSSDSLFSASFSNENITSLLVNLDNLLNIHFINKQG